MSLQRRGLGCWTRTCQEFSLCVIGSDSQPPPPHLAMFILSAESWKCIESFLVRDPACVFADHLTGSCYMKKILFCKLRIFLCNGRTKRNMLQKQNHLSWYSLITKAKLESLAKRTCSRSWDSVLQIGQLRWIYT